MINKGNLRTTIGAVLLACMLLSGCGKAEKALITEESKAKQQETYTAYSAEGYRFAVTADDSWTQETESGAFELQLNELMSKRDNSFGIDLPKAEETLWVVANGMPSHILDNKEAIEKMVEKISAAY